MLTPSQILKVAHMNAQYGPGEDTFSPDWHEKNSAPTEGSALAGKRIEAGERVITLRLRHVLLPSGDVVIRNVTDGEALNDGERFVD